MSILLLVRKNQKATAELEGDLFQNQTFGWISKIDGVVVIVVMFAGVGVDCR